MSDSHTNNAPGRDNTSISDMQEITTGDTYEVAVIHDEHGELGTLDSLFYNEFDASMAAHDAAIDAVGVTTEIRVVDE